MDIYTLNRAKNIQDELISLREEKDIWESATNFCTGIEVRSNTGIGQYGYHRSSDIRISVIKED